MQSALRWFIEKAVRYFLAGAFAVLPLVITVAIVAWVAEFLQKLVGPNAPLGILLSKVGLVGLGREGNATLAYAIGWVLVLAVIFGVGVLVEAGARGLVQRMFDGMVSRIPLVGGIYGTTKQVVAMLDKKGDDRLTGMQAVFCYFGKERGCGVLALLVSPEKFRVAGSDYLIVIVPTAPVPVGGGLLFVPADMVQRVDLSVESLMSIYVSMGVTAPQFLPGDAPAIVAK